MIKELIQTDFNHPSRLLKRKYNFHDYKYTGLENYKLFFSLSVVGRKRYFTCIAVVLSKIFAREILSLGKMYG